MKRIIIFLEGRTALSVDDGAHNMRLVAKPVPLSLPPKVLSEHGQSIAETIGSIILIKALLWKDVWEELLCRERLDEMLQGSFQLSIGPAKLLQEHTGKARVRLGDLALNCNSFTLHGRTYAFFKA